MLVFSATDQPAYGYSCNGDEVELFSVRKDQQSGGAGASAADTSLDVSDGAVTLETSFESSRDGYPDLYDSNPTDECDDNDISFRVYDDSVEIVENSISIVEPVACSGIEVGRFTGPLASRGGSTGRSSSSDIPISVGVVDKIQDSQGVSVMDFISRCEGRNVVIDEVVLDLVAELLSRQIQVGIDEGCDVVAEVSRNNIQELPELPEYGTRYRIPLSPSGTSTS